MIDFTQYQIIIKSEFESLLNYSYLDIMAMRLKRGTYVHI